MHSPGQHGLWVCKGSFKHRVDMGNPGSRPIISGEYSVNELRLCFIKIFHHPPRSIWKPLGSWGFCLCFDFRVY